MNRREIASGLTEARFMAQVTVKNVPELKTDEVKPRNARKKAAFLRAFGSNLSVTASARLAGIDRTTHYEWLDKDSRYKAAFEATLSMAADLMVEQLSHSALVGDFKPIIYKGRFCYATRERIICQLADGTSAFEDEMPKGAEVTSRRTVTVHDGEMIGQYRKNSRALITMLALRMPEKFGDAFRRERKPRDR